jgi:hypothetical protein
MITFKSAVCRHMDCWLLVVFILTNNLKYLEQEFLSRARLFLYYYYMNYYTGRTFYDTTVKYRRA